jgi:glycosyltransferase involved in cell wall biosynthesis
VQNILLKNIPKISIYLPIYNKSKYLMESIKSIQNQTLKDIEIIAVNDCSTDDSLVILKKKLKMIHE